MTDFTPWQSLLGGALIGLSAVLLMAFHGRIAGMTGILSGVIPDLVRADPDAKARNIFAGMALGPEWGWRAAFLAGAIAAPLAITLAGGEIAFDVPVSTGALLAGGFLVGIGVHFGNGCPSGHGICGLARLSPRSLAAVPTFMATAFVTVFVARHVIGG